MKTRALLFFALGAGVTPGAMAGLPFEQVPSIEVPGVTTTTVVPGQASRTSNRGYAGLKWNIPGPLAPTLVVGVRRAKVESDGDTKGADLSFGLSFAGGMKPEKLRLKGFMGKDKVQGEIGGGWDFTASSLYLGPSVNFPYVNLGLDWMLNDGLKPYVMIHTMGKYDKPIGSTTVTQTGPSSFVCPEGSVDDGPVDINNPNGPRQCFQPLPPGPPPPPPEAN